MEKAVKGTSASSRLLRILLSVCLALSLAFGYSLAYPASAYAAEGDSFAEPYEHDLAEGDVVITTGGYHRVSDSADDGSQEYASAFTITVNATDPVTLIVDGLRISSETSPVTIGKSATVDMVLLNKSTMTATSQGYAGINTQSPENLAIHGPGELVATGAMFGAGIGGNGGQSGGVTIYGGSITAVAGYASAGIGGSYFNLGTVVVYGGDIRASGDSGGAGIGGGYYQAGEVRIYGGAIDAKGSGGGAGIGGGCAGIDGAGIGETVIHGGIISAVGGGGSTEAAGSGGGAGIGGGGSDTLGSSGGEGTVTIYGGNIKATGGDGSTTNSHGGGAGIGGGGGTLGSLDFNPPTPGTSGGEGIISLAEPLNIDAFDLTRGVGSFASGAFPAGGAGAACGDGGAGPTQNSVHPGADGDEVTPTALDAPTGALMEHFSIAGEEATIEGTEIILLLPPGHGLESILTSVAPSFVVSSGATVSAGAAIQTSGKTEQDLSGSWHTPLTYTVHSADGSASTTYTVRVGTLYPYITQFPTYTGQAEGIEARIDAAYVKFANNGMMQPGASVRVGTLTLSEGTHYKHKTSSTSITLLPAYLDTLPNGTYAIEVHFVDGSAETASFEVAKAVNPNNKDIPQTGDTDTILLLIAGGLALAGLALCGQRVRAHRRNKSEIS